ncbi:hypothetical protein PUMCH_001488 [Australozyma saopauloensis]|uniref:Cytochrome c oxidase assembly protein COX20, mitochondrial n=1 Tax=Australozyma saopauloensis TaxID=291208 RepID=A0AAX4H8B5_9ASCO|nr:hypothetical protein PUMCH_001488 [[Candida] saopauloensis]
MGWFSRTPARVSTAKEVTPEEAKGRTQLLEDLEPKFEDGPQSRQPPTVTEAVKLLQWSDISLDRYFGMPCFREAMLTGFQAMGVLGVVTLVIHKNPSRSVKWGLGGFFLGSVVGWEQCRSLRRRSFATVEAARRKNQEVVRQKLEEEGTK